MKNTGVCKNKNCTKPISEHGEANEKRYCEEHYEIHKEKNRIKIENRISKMADKFISSKKLSQLEALISNNKVKEEISRKRVNKKWRSHSIKRKSDVKDIIESREWKNTQELIKRKNVVCVEEHFMNYVQDVCYLYSLKLLHSRQYLDKDNAYKNHIIPPLGNVNPIVILKLEVAFSFNPYSDASMSTDDIILIPAKIRRMISMKKASLKRKLKEAPHQNDKNKNKNKNKSKNKKTKSKTKNKRNGIYHRIQRENAPEEVSKFMNKMRKQLKELPFTSFARYPPFLYNPIEKCLPLYRLAQIEYIRVYQGIESHLFVKLENKLSGFQMYLEAFAILSFHALMAGKGKGRELIAKALSWIEDTTKNSITSIEYITNHIENIFMITFGNNIEYKSGFVNMYNSFFSEDVIEVSSESKTITSIRKNLFENNFQW